MRKLILFFVLCLSNSVFAETNLFPYKYYNFVLDNGLKVILIPVKNAGLVSYFTVVHAGSRDEVESGKSGFAHFFEHMMFRGTEKFPADKWAEITTSMGADNNAYTSDDMTVYYLHFPSRYLEKVIELESDRFMNLKYSLSAFQTEAKAVLGEYNKNFANPFFQLEEKLRELAFEKSTYEHSPMGFLKDIEQMPNQYDYSLQFFDRFYRPNNCTLLITGNINPDEALSLVKKYYGAWKPGTYKTVNPEEPPQKEERRDSISYPGDTLPLIAIAYRAPRYSPDNKEFAALYILTQLAFGETSPLYQKLVLQEQKADFIGADNEPHRDPYLFVVYSRLKDPKDLSYVEENIDKTIEEIRTKEIDEKRLTDIKSNLKYSFLMSLDTSRSTAYTLAPLIAQTRSIEDIEKTLQTMDSITTKDIVNAVEKYLQKQNRTVVTLTGGRS